MKPTNRIGVNDEILSLESWKGLKVACTWPLKNKNRGSHLEDQACSEECGGPYWGGGEGRNKLYEKGKGQVQIMIHKSVGRFLQRQSQLFAVKKALCKKLPEFSFKSGSKRSRFKGIKNRWLMVLKKCTRGENKQ